MFKIIFLDIDGVLNIYCESRDDYGCIFHQHLVDNLKYIIDNTNAKIVISSSWAADGIEKLCNMWKHRNYPGEIIDVIYNRIENEKSVHRGILISEWLDANKGLCNNYCIIDDDIIRNHNGNYVNTADNTHHYDSVDIGYGLTKECAEQVINILK